MALSGLLFGFVLSRLGFSSYGEVHRMFTLADLRLLLAFAGAVPLIWAVFMLTGPRGLPRRPIHRGLGLGGVLFGMGWALTGACPSVPLVQLGEGQLVAGLTLVGIIGGMLFCRRVLAPIGKFSSGGSCGSDL